MLNGIFRCKKGWGDYMTEGNFYEFENGQVVYDDGNSGGVLNPFQSLEDFNCRCNSQIAVVNMSKYILESEDEVIYRDGDSRIFLATTGTFHNIYGDKLNTINKYTDDLISTGLSCNDIMKIFRKGTLICQRVEKTKTNVEIEKIETEMRTISELQTKLADKLKDLKGGL